MEILGVSAEDHRAGRRDQDVVRWTLTDHATLEKDPQRLRTRPNWRAWTLTLQTAIEIRHKACGHREGCDVYKWQGARMHGIKFAAVVGVALPVVASSADERNLAMDAFHCAAGRADAAVVIRIDSAQYQQIGDSVSTLFGVTVLDALRGASDVRYLRTPGGRDDTGAWISYSHMPKFQVGDVLLTALVSTQGPAEYRISNSSVGYWRLQSIGLYDIPIAPNGMSIDAVTFRSTTASRPVAEASAVDTLESSNGRPVARPAVASTAWTPMSWATFISWSRARMNGGEPGVFEESCVAIGVAPYSPRKSRATESELNTVRRSE